MRCSSATSGKGRTEFRAPGLRLVTRLATFGASGKGSGEAVLLHQAGIQGREGQGIFRGAG